MTNEVNEMAGFYEAVGGHDFFVSLVDAFYARVEVDELLMPMYPEDLTEARLHLVWFLEQYFGGPTTYAQERGHPRLRMRHADFRITKRARDAWLAAMNGALDEAGSQLSPDARQEFDAYFTMAAKSLRNV